MLNFGSWNLHGDFATVDVLCFSSIAFFLGFDDVEPLVAGWMVEGNGSALLIVMMSTVPGVFVGTWPLILNGTSVLLILLLMDRLADVDRCLDMREEGW